VRQRPVGPVGEDLLHERVVAVLLLGLDQLDREQLVLPGQVADPADDQPGGDRPRPAQHSRQASLPCLAEVTMTCPHRPR
jgi:hypothetical protein